jgi:hypothetical protein
MSRVRFVQKVERLFAITKARPNHGRQSWVHVLRLAEAIYGG